MALLMFRRNKKIGSRLIQWATQYHWSHVGVLCKDGLIYHSDSSGAHSATTEEFSKDSEIDFMPIIGDDDEMLARAQSRLGDKYDFPALLWFALVLFLKKISIKIPRLVINPKWIVCSEYAEFIVFGTASTSLPEELAMKVIRDNN
jgi:hypothetical protein